MLNYDEDSQNAKILAQHYAKQVGGDFLFDFMSGAIGISTKGQLCEVIEGFWKMTDLAISDNENDKTIEGIYDIEFWMQKLFIKVNGYMTKHGHSEKWDEAMQER